MPAPVAARSGSNNTMVKIKPVIPPMDAATIGRIAERRRGAGRILRTRSCMSRLALAMHYVTDEKKAAIFINRALGVEEPRPDCQAGACQRVERAEALPGSSRDVQRHRNDARRPPAPHRHRHRRRKHGPCRSRGPHPRATTIPKIRLDKKLLADMPAYVAGRFPARARSSFTIN